MTVLRLSRVRRRACVTGVSWVGDLPPSPDDSSASEGDPRSDVAGGGGGGVGCGGGGGGGGGAYLLRIALGSAPLARQLSRDLSMDALMCDYASAPDPHGEEVEEEGGGGMSLSLPARHEQHVPPPTPLALRRALSGSGVSLALAPSPKRVRGGGGGTGDDDVSLGAAMSELRLADAATHGPDAPPLLHSPMMGPAATASALRQSAASAALRPPLPLHPSLARGQTRACPVVPAPPPPPPPKQQQTLPRAMSIEVPRDTGVSGAPAAAAAAAARGSGREHGARPRRRHAVEKFRSETVNLCVRACLFVGT